MRWCALELCGAVAVLLLFSVARPAYGAPSRDPAAGSTETAAEAKVEELPQRAMTLQNGYHPGLFPFNKGEPFVVDPNMGAIDFNTKPPPPRPQQHSDDYYDYDASKLEEVPYDYKGDPIDRKDVVAPSAPRPNDIKPNGGVKNKQTDIYHFLNLPVKYSSSDKFPLMSSSYANTKIQGSGSSSLSNHKMPATATPAPPAPTTSWYNPVKTAGTTTTTAPPATTTTPTTTSTTTTTTTTTPAPSQEYEEESVYDYDYFHQQEPAPVSDTAPVIASSTTTTSTTSTTTEQHRSPPSAATASPVRPTVVTPSTARAPSTDSTATSSSDNYDTYDDDDDRPQAPVLNRTSTTTSTTTTSTSTTTTTTTTARPEIDSKLDGPSFADYDAIKPSAEGGELRPQQQQQQQHESYGIAGGQQHFKPTTGSYPFASNKTYPLITSGKMPMTFTAHVSSGISLNQKEPAVHQHQYHHTSEPAAKPVVSEPPPPPYAASRPSPPSPQPPQQVQDPKQRPQRPSDGGDMSDAVYYKVKPDAQPFPAAVTPPLYRPAANQPPAQGPRPYMPESPAQGPRPYMPESPVIVKTSPDRPKPPVNPAEPPPALARPPPQPFHPAQSSDVYAVKHRPPPPPQYVAPQSQPDTSKFKPPKHVINHFIKTQPNEDNKSYALQTSFSIGMDGERTASEARPVPQGVGQVLMVEDVGSADQVVNLTAAHAVKPVVNRATTSIPFVPPPPQQRPGQKLGQQQQQQYPRPQWENAPKPAPPPYYQPPPKRDGAPPPPPPPQRANLPNILPQFRPNAKMDAPPMMVPQSHSATIERVQIPMDHLRPPPLPKPQYLRVDRNDEDDVIGPDAADDKVETRIIMHRAGGPPQQPAKVTTLQMIQHGASASSAPAAKAAPPAVRQDDRAGDDPAAAAVHVVYAANAPPHRPTADRLHADDPVLLDAKDRFDVPVLKTKAAAANRPAKPDFPYQIVKPDDGPGAPEYNAYTPTKTADAARPNELQELVPNLQDYVPVVTRGDPTAVPPQKPITATLRTTEDSHMTPEDGHRTPVDGHRTPVDGHRTPVDGHRTPVDGHRTPVDGHRTPVDGHRTPVDGHRTSEDGHRTPEDGGGHKPQLQNFQIPFQPSMKLPENSNGWSVVRKPQVDNSASERTDETDGDAVTSTEKFDPDNFKPHLVGGFMPINPLLEDAKEKKTADQLDRA